MQLVDYGHVVNFPGKSGCDAIYIDFLDGLYILCDGANGCRDGQQAAIWLSRYLGENLGALKGAPIPDSYLEKLVHDANAFLIGNFVDGCSTLLGLYLSAEQTVCFSVGDSFIYAFNKEADSWNLHSQLPRDVDEFGNPWQLVGSDALAKIHCQTYTNMGTQAFVLLSDGIGNFIKLEDIGFQLISADDRITLEEAAVNLANLAIDRGSKDDLSALMIRIKSKT